MSKNLKTYVAMLKRGLEDSAKAAPGLDVDGGEVEQWGKVFSDNLVSRCAFVLWSKTDLYRPNTERWSRWPT
jgi:hypothetical protein